MPDFLGFDTSNYTTSVAIFEKEQKQIIQEKQLLPVKEKAVGIRQSDAVFEHVRQLPEVMQKLFPIESLDLRAVGASVQPRNTENSYMPCFLVGKAVAEGIALSNGIPFYSFSHQAGHIISALYSAGNLSLINEPFFAFHASGGTTELLEVFPDEKQIIREEIFSQTLDLNAGQAVDRVGALLEIPFPAGRALEKLAGADLASQMENPKTQPTLRENDCSLSGVENRCEKLYEEGASKEECAQFLFASLAQTFIGMTKKAFDEKRKRPIIFAGGVLSNRLIQSEIQKSLGGEEKGVFFADPEFARDNAAGISILTALKNEREELCKSLQ